MTAPDLINGAFECFGGVAVFQSILKLRKDKKVAGVAWQHILFFLSWGLWNLFYYPHLGQWASFVGGVGVVAANTAYILMLWHFTKYPGGKKQWTVSS